MNKTEAIVKLREKQRKLKQAEMVMEVHENTIREIKEDIAKIEKFINKKKIIGDLLKSLTNGKNYMKKKHYLWKI